ncbi:MAG: hypothetical protein HYZ28_01315 [Myxococcales bacterium]|nr:hypothetical protein [Myxococcales bacterium]
MKAPRWLPVAALLLLLSPGVAEAAGVRLGVGAHYWLERKGVFDLDLAVDGALSRHIAVGARFGALITSMQPQLGVPLDLQLRAVLGGGRVYLEGMAGPWIFFTSSGPVRAHVAFGFGLQSSALAFGIELGWLDPAGIVGARVAFRL